MGGMAKERLDEAESVFRDDLKLHPKNPWALRGLTDVLREKRFKGIGEVEIEEIDEWGAIFTAQRSSINADASIDASCACAIKK